MMGPFRRSGIPTIPQGMLYEQKALFASSQAQARRKWYVDQILTQCFSGVLPTTLFQPQPCDWGRQKREIQNTDPRNGEAEVSTCIFALWWWTISAWDGVKDLQMALNRDDKSGDPRTPCLDIGQHYMLDPDELLNNIV